MSHLLPDSRTMTGFDPRYFDALPQARMHLGQNRIRLAELKMELERSRNKSHERKLDIIQAEVKELEKEIATLRKRIRLVEHEQEHEIWCGIGAVVEATVSGSWRARGKVEGVTDMYCWIRCHFGRIIVQKLRCVGVYYANRIEARNFEVENYHAMTGPEQDDLVDPLEPDPPNIIIEEPWCQVGSVVKYLEPETFTWFYGKVEGRTEKNLWVHFEGYNRVRIKKRFLRPYLSKWESQDEDYEGPYQMMRPRDVIDPEIDSDVNSDDESES